MESTVRGFQTARVVFLQAALICPTNIGQARLIIVNKYIFIGKKVGELNSGKDVLNYFDNSGTCTVD